MGRSHMLRNRILTAAALIFIAIYSVTFAETQFASLLLFVIGGGLAGAEFVAMRWHVIDGLSHSEFPRPPMRREFFGIGAAYAMCLPIEYLGRLYFGEHSNVGTSLVFAWIALCMVVGSVFFYKREIDLEIGTHKLMNGLAGFIYVAIPAITMFKLSQIAIEGAPRGIALYFTLAVIFMGDTGAYFTGRAIGSTPLLPKVSPKKTLEGAIGGLVTSGVTGIFICLFFQLPFSWVVAAAIAVISGLAGQVGDLVESALKRAANCKDSGHLLPGHGGALDRVDSLLFGVPISYLLFLFIDFT